jgi:hypothetical protein
MLGEYQFPPLMFHGRDRCHAKRKALDYWYRHRDQLRLNLRDFFRCCRLSADERTITFFFV